MRKILFSSLLAVISLLILSSCSTTESTASAYINRVCSMCNGKGYILEQDRTYWPHVTFMTVHCSYCGGKGYVNDMYFYLDNGYIIYNYPHHMPHRYRPARPAHKFKSVRPAPRHRTVTPKGGRFGRGHKPRR